MIQTSAHNLLQTLSLMKLDLVEFVLISCAPSDSQPLVISIANLMRRCEILFVIMNDAGVNRP